MVSRKVRDRLPSRSNPANFSKQEHINTLPTQAGIGIGQSRLRSSVGSIRENITRRTEAIEDKKEKKGSLRRRIWNSMGNIRKYLILKYMYLEANKAYCRSFSD